MSSKEYFSSIAPKWDSIREGFFSESLRDKAIALSGAKPGERAADIGAGTGFMTEGLLDAGLTVLAVDESPEMLREAYGKFGKSPRFSAKSGTATKIPLADSEMDYVFANMLLHHVEEPQKAVKEMWRVLKPGGIVTLTDLYAHDFEFLRSEQHDRWMGFERDQVRSWLRSAGFASVRVEDLDETCSSKSESGAEAKVRIFAAVGQKPAKKAIK